MRCPAAVAPAGLLPSIFAVFDLAADSVRGPIFYAVDGTASPPAFTGAAGRRKQRQTG